MQSSRDADIVAPVRDFIGYLLLPAAVGGLVGLVVVSLARDDAPRRDPGDTGFAHAVALAAPSVVNIYSTKTMVSPMCEIPRFQDWCDAFRRQGVRRQSSLGSGVVVRPDGYILTNNHVIAGADEILVAFANGQATNAAVVGTDSETDLAVIRVDGMNLPAVLPGASETIQVGEIALAIGNPFGIGQTVSQGIVSATARAGISANPYDDFIQTDAAINPGNSGGALINAAGELIGINTLIFSRSGGSQGIGFAIPSALALTVLDEIIRTGRVQRGWLGVTLNVSQGPNGPALEIASVVSGGPAAQVGIVPGDRIAAINGHPVMDADTASREIAAVKPGTQVALALLRGAERLTVNVVSGERSSRQPRR